MSATGRIHAGKKIEPGGRYDRFLAFLRARGRTGATTMEIIAQARVCAVSAVASELRAMGYTVECQPDGRSEDGGAVYRYWLVEALAAGAAQRDLFEGRG